MKRSLQIVLSILCCIGLVLSIRCIREGSLTTTQEFQLHASIALPSRLLITRLGIDAAIEPVGVLGGAMAVPERITDVGWYSFGIRPGNVGSAVLAGHANWTGGQDAVFTKLRTIQRGDMVQVKNTHGDTDTFVVRDIRDYPVNADTGEVFSSFDGARRLNLITCDGPWSTTLKTHESRLVVFTEKM